ncbi:hypothetical protein MTO96_035649 [Rhipicephalus appendiculatus]
MHSNININSRLRCNFHELNTSGYDGSRENGRRPLQLRCPERHRPAIALPRAGEKGALQEGDSAPRGETATALLQRGCFGQVMCSAVVDPCRGGREWVMAPKE